MIPFFILSSFEEDERDKKLNKQLLKDKKKKEKKNGWMQKGEKAKSWL